jgi:hypothetical protein
MCKHVTGAINLTHFPGFDFDGHIPHFDKFNHPANEYALIDLPVIKRDDSLSLKRWEQIESKLSKYSETLRILKASMDMAPGFDPNAAANAGVITSANINTLSDLARNKLPASLINVSTEQSTTQVVDDTDAVLNAVKAYLFFQVPSAYDFIVCTGLAVKNGTTINGIVQMGVDIVNAIPPSIGQTATKAMASGANQAGANAYQRFPIQSSVPLLASENLGVWVNSNSATGAYRQQTGAGSQNQQKSVAYTANIGWGDGAAAVWVPATTRFALQMFYLGFK